MEWWNAVSGGCCLKIFWNEIRKVNETNTDEMQKKMQKQMQTFKQKPPSCFSNNIKTRLKSRKIFHDSIFFQFHSFHLKHTQKRFFIPCVFHKQTNKAKIIMNTI